ncbi:MAG: chorismate mutase [Acidobacteria bacterium 13_1_20CM_2_60_10]|nr:MAG: chorismate mutase [Acidobacteria bacterium 13_1_20CM_2_60_10]
MTINEWRRRIDEIDKKLVELLNERARCAIEIGHIKQAEHQPLYQPERERDVLESVERANGGPLSHAAIRRLFERIIDEARSIERTAMHPDGAAEDDSQLNSRAAGPGRRRGEKA